MQGQKLSLYIITDVFMPFFLSDWQLKSVFQFTWPRVLKSKWLDGHGFKTCPPTHMAAGAEFYFLPYYKSSM